MDPDAAFRLQVASLVDSYFEKAKVDKEYRNAMRMRLESGPFDMYSKDPWDEVEDVLCVLFPTIVAPLTVTLRRELEKELKVMFTAHRKVMSLQPAVLSPEQQELQQAFNAPFKGTAHERLFRHLIACHSLLHRNRHALNDPCFAIAQSSGFGKSRLLRELASTIAVREMEKDEGVCMQVVYVCARKEQTELSSFPPATQVLHDYLFPLTWEAGRLIDSEKQESLTQQLLSLYEVVMAAPWKPMNDKLMGRFVGNDGGLTAELEHHEPGTVVKDERPRLLVLAVDEARSLLPSSEKRVSINWLVILRRTLRDVEHLISDRFGSRSTMMAIMVDTYSNISNSELSALVDPSSRGVASHQLLDPFILTDTIDLFVGGEDKMATYKQAVLAAADPAQRDASWKILLAYGRPLWKVGLPKKYSANKVGVVQFAAAKLLGGPVAAPPFTLDVNNYNGVAALLCRLGLRPYSTTKLASRLVDYMAVLSYVSYKHDQIVSSYSSDPILTLGATYLWHERPGNLADSMLPQLRRLLMDETLDTGGVGELVARVLLLLVMDASGVLETGKEASRWESAGSFVSVWSFLLALHGNLPKLRVVNEQDLAQAYATAEAKAKVKAKAKAKEKSESIAKAIAMSNAKDKAKAKANAKAKAVSTTEEGPAKPLVVPLTRRMLELADVEATQLALDELTAQWEPCLLTFTHFVQLDNEPTEDCLWAMLARRAAGLFPRGQKGVDLVLPVFVPGVDAMQQPQVSMILVQVKNRLDADASFPGSAIYGTRPENCFHKTNGLRRLSPDKVLRVHMSLAGNKDSERYYVRDDHDGVESGGESYVCCIQGIGEWTTTIAQAGDGGAALSATPTPVATASTEVAKEQSAVCAGLSSVEVISESVAASLQSLLRPWWKVVELVEHDWLEMNSKVLARIQQGSLEKATRIAQLPLAVNLLVNGGPDVGGDVGDAVTEAGGAEELGVAAGDGGTKRHSSGGTEGEASVKRVRLSPCTRSGQA